MYLRTGVATALLLAAGCSPGQAANVAAPGPQKLEIPIKGEGIGDPCRIANVLNGDLSIDRGGFGYVITEWGFRMRDDIRYPVIRAVLSPQRTGYFEAWDPWGEMAFDVEGSKIMPRQENCGAWTTEKIAGDSEGRWSIKRDGQQVATIQGEWPPKF